MPKATARLQFPLGLLAICSTLAFATIARAQTPTPAQGMRVTSVSNASGFDDLTTPMIIYGGIAGGVPNAVDPTTGLGNNCAGQTTLVPCNERKILGTTNLTISFVTGSKAGRPELWRIPTTGTKVRIPPLVDPGTVAANSTATITVSWSTICTTIRDETNQTLDGNCDTAVPNTFTKIADTLKLGIDGTAVPNQSIEDAEDEKIDVQIVVANLPPNNGALSTVLNCDSGNTEGICGFNVRAGDEKVAISDLRGEPGFPNGTIIPYRQLRVFWAEGTRNPQGLTPANASGSRDLEISRPGAVAGGEISVTPQRIDGFKNDIEYAFKVATVDAAGNIGNFTDDAVSADVNLQCEGFDLRPEGCHSAMPGEVVGVLSEPMNCFVATAAYGSPIAKQVNVLRTFRDRVLIPSKWGVKFVSWYYKTSPKYARYIADSETLRAVSRVLLLPLLLYAWLSLQIGAIAALIVMTTLCVVPYGIMRALRPKDEGSVRA